MKLCHLPTLCAALLALCPTLATAQTSAVPGFISYQGRVVDAAGANVGAGTPVNRTVIFRIWDTPSSTNTGNLIYSEAQTVTVSDGEFSVLVGQGVANPTETFGYSEADKKLVDLGTAFNGSARYLGVTVAAAATIALTDNEITPRQQIVSTAFAMRAKVAESVDANAISSAMLATGAVGSTQLAAASVTNAKLGTDAVLAANIGNLNVTTAKLADLAVTTGKIADANVTTGKIANNAVDNTKLRDSAGLSVIGRKINSVGDPTDIVAATDGHVLRRSGVSVDFGTVGTAGIADGAITGAKIASDTSITVGQLQSNGRVMTKSLEFWPPAGNLSALFKAGVDVYPTNSSATAGDMVLLGSPRLHLATANNGAAVMTLSGANVGIGTTTPTEARLVIKGQPTSLRPINGGNMHYLYPTGGVANLADNTTWQSITQYLSIYADKGVQSSFSILFSDKRIKNVVGRSDAGKDLTTLQQIEVSDYFYKDVAEHGSRPQKKVIAQQVERVFPQAVSRSTLVVPDVFKEGAFRDGWVTLKSDLKAGDRVRLIAESEEGLHEVLEVKGDSFRTAFKAAGDKVFVYGREVDDFRSVDYDAIAMLNVSATQQIKREKDAEIQALRDENATLRRELAAKDASLETRLIALERQMALAAATETVSLKTEQAAK